MSKTLLSWCVSTLTAFAVFSASTARAAHDFSQTGGGTFDSNNSGNWSGGVPTGDGQDVNFTQTINSGNQVITNLFSANGSSLNYLRLATGGTSLLTVITQSGTGIDSFYGLQLNARDTLILNGGNSTLSHGNNSFDNNNGTLVVSNGGTAFVNIGTGNVMNNAGTIELTATAGQTSGLNYGQTARLDNNSGKTIVKNGAGTGSFVGNFGGNNQEFRNNGTILVNAGTLEIDSRDAFSGGGFTNTGTGHIIIESGAALRVERTQNAWNGSAWGNAGTVNLRGGLYVTGVDGSGDNINVTNNNGGTIFGNGTLAFALRNDTGTLAASNGTLHVTGKIIGAGGNFNAINTGTLNLRGGALGAGGTINGGAMTVGSGSAIVFAGDNDWTINNAASYAGGSLISSNSSGGSEALFLNNAAFRNNAGNLVVVNNGINFGQIGSALTNAVGGWITGIGTLNGNFGANNQGIRNLSTITSVAGGTLTLDTSDAFSLGGLNNAGTLDVANNSTLVLRRTDNAWNNAGAVFPTNTGFIVLNGGTLRGENAGGGAASRIVNANGGVASGSGTLANNFSNLQNDGRILANSSSALNLAATFLHNTATGAITNNAGFLNFLSGTTTTNLGVIATVSGGVTTNAGTIIVGALSTQGTLSGDVVNTGTLVFNRSDAISYNDVISSTGKLIKRGSSTTTLGGGNTYTGNTEIDLGTLAVSGDIANGSTIYIGNGITGGNAALALSANGVDLGSTIQVNVDGGAGTGTRTIVSSAASGSTTISGQINMNTNLTVQATAGSALTVAGVNLSNLNNNDLTVTNTTGSDVTIGGVITAATGASDLNKNGTGTLILSGNNSGSNYKLNINQGTVVLDNANALGSTAGYVGKVNFANNSGTLQVSQNIATGAGVTMSVGSGISGIFDVDASRTFTLNGTITGAGGVTKAGSGTMVFSSGHTSTYTGNTLVDTGTLIVNGNIASSALTTVDSGGYLKGGGTVGALTLSGGGFSPGNSPGTLNAGNTTWSSGSWYDWEINDVDAGAGTDPGWDLLNVTGTLDVGSGFTVFVTSLTLGNVSGNVADFNSANTYQWVIAQTTGGVLNYTAGDIALNLANFTNPYTGVWSVSADANSIYVNYNGSLSAVPEPSLIALLVGGAATAYLARRRMRKA